MEMATEDVNKGLLEGWVDKPIRHLPFVPCRMQPRGIVMQSRTRVGADGKLEEYLKPRLTTDNSFGGVDSCNAAVPDQERTVALPSAQSFGRGWGIVQSIFDGEPYAEGGNTKAFGYCVDAEAAYRFCPVQHADLWQQCFCWWDEQGSAGFSTDHRMGFGGAFAPNRFERVSTFVCALAAHLQRKFDSEQPPPACAQRWSNDKRALQQQGLLPDGDFQCDPNFIQSFIDDFCGAAGDDTISPPTSVENIKLDVDHMRKMGCMPPPEN
jgi:hypothetical protein